jgi:IS5 family transposase
MKPNDPNNSHTDDLFRSHLNQIINMRHELVVLAERIDWASFYTQLEAFYAQVGRPAIPSLPRVFNG